ARPGRARVGATGQAGIRQPGGRGTAVHPRPAAPNLLHAELPRRGARSRLARRRGALPRPLSLARAAAGAGPRARGPCRRDRLPWLDKARVLDGAAKLISGSAVAARSFIGYLDLGADGEEVWRPPRTQGDLGHLVDGRPFRAPSDNVERGLEQLVRQRRDVPAGSFLFLLSDFLVPPGRTTWMRAGPRRWAAVPVLIQDPIWDASFPDVAGLVVPYVDPDTGEVTRVRLSDKETERLRAANESRLAELRATFRSLGLDAVEISSDGHADMLAAFLAWADRRQYTRGRKW